jgi:hypothetical protein
MLEPTHMFVAGGVDELGAIVAVSDPVRTNGKWVHRTAERNRHSASPLQI